MSPGKLLRPLFIGPSARAELIVCPFGGGSTSAFRSWRELPPLRALSAWLVTYPGRDQRISEPFPSIDAVAAELALELRSSSSPRRWILVGHSLGAQIAFETCALLERAGTPPRGLVLSGCHAPHLRPRHLLSGLEDSEFVERLVALGGCPRALLSEPELRRVYLPMLRRDFEIAEGYGRSLEDGLRLCTPALLLNGRNDGEASASEVQAWTHWLGSTRHHELEGDHFYITQAPRTFLRLLATSFELGDEPGHSNHDL